MKNTFILTVGTSLKTNLLKENLKFEKSSLNILSNRNLDDRIFGAEINSFNKLIEKKDIYKENAYLIATDTEDSLMCAELIKEIMKNRMEVKNVEVIKVNDLSGDNIRKFETKGLRNLVNEVVNIIRKNNIENISILPIGGFKVEISLITTIANVFNIDSFYMYEGFADIIKIPSLPINVDYFYILDEFDLFYKLKNNETIELSKELEDKIKNKKEYNVLIQYTEIYTINYLELSAFGLLLMEKLELDKSLVRLTKVENKKSLKKDMQRKNNEPSAEKVFSDTKFLNLMEKILDTGYIEKIICNYYNPKNKGTQIEVKKSSNFTEGRVIKVVYNNNYGLGEVELVTTAKNELETEVIIDKIKEII